VVLKKIEWCQQREPTNAEKLSLEERERERKREKER
jgi:hypothetical protein